MKLKREAIRACIISLIFLLSNVLIFRQNVLWAQSRALVAYWKFDEGYGEFASDSSGNGNTGRLVNGPQWVDGVVGKALKFDGKDDYVYVPHSPSLDISGNQITIEYWMKLAVDWHPGIDATYVIYDKGDAYVGSMIGSTGAHRFNLPYILPYPETNKNSWKADVWYHIADVYDGSYIKIYVNGVLDKAVPITGSIPRSTINFAIGSQCIQAWPFYFNGTIDEFAIYNYAKTAEEIWNDYNSVSVHAQEELYSFPSGAIGPARNLAYNPPILFEFSPQIVTAAPGQTVSFTVSYQTWTPPELGGPGVIWQLLAIVSWTPSWPPPAGYYIPLYDGIAGRYPGVSQTQSFSVTVPSTPGTYYIWFCYNLHYSMEQAITGFTNPLSLPAHVKIIVRSSEGNEVLELPAGAWYPGNLSLHTILLDINVAGQGQVAIVAPGQTISVSYIMQIFANPVAPGEIRQAFFGYAWASSWPPWDAYTEIYNGIPGPYPGVTKTGTFNIKVPTQPGSYNIWLLGGSEYNMHDAVTTHKNPPTVLPHAKIIVQQQHGDARVENQYFVSVSSPYGFPTGGGWYLKGSTATISISQTIIDHGNGTRRIFNAWREEGSLMSNVESFTIIVNGHRSIVAVWDTEYEVRVSSEKGTTVGSGWFKSGDTATVSISSTRLEKDHFADYVFEGWRVGGSIVSTSPTYSFTVDRPVTLVASWRTEIKLSAIGLIAGVILLVVVPAAILMARRRKPSPPSPPTPPESETEKETRKLEEYLEKLEQLKKEGKVSEKVYEKLKEEYEKKLEELIDKLKK